MIQWLKNILPDVFSLKGTEASEKDIERKLGKVIKSLKKLLQIKKKVHNVE